jgi:hypothetical protein
MDGWCFYNSSTIIHVLHFITAIHSIIFYSPKGRQLDIHWGFWFYSRGKQEGIKSTIWAHVIRTKENKNVDNVIEKIRFPCKVKVTPPLALVNRECVKLTDTRSCTVPYSANSHTVNRILCKEKVGSHFLNCSQSFLKGIVSRKFAILLLVSM